ncbi:hypothetical protein H6P81_008434 [Aristolochia fimbriata]|uniref:Heparanase-like protein 3 n=1 Tax=Aristolochia fimbriata TaxID=158543 RepID=A0AAV7EIA0_ARIFI|nr:hypothetical protein H6P81_008434 [Aristolochia fimbriata]
MGTFFLLRHLSVSVFIFVLRLAQNARGASENAAVQGTVSINGSSAIGRIDGDFVCATMDWWPPEKCDYGTCSWDRASLLNLDLSNIILLNAIKAFSPLKIRLGGTLQDKVIYATEGSQQLCPSFIKNSSELFGFSQGCLPMSRWDQLNDFFMKAKVRVIFGLNALNGRIPMSDGSMGGPWNYSNAASLIRYTVNKGYSIYGWELGNELSGSGVGTKIGAAQYAADMVSLRSIVQKIYEDVEVKPLLLAPGGFFDASWFQELIDKSAPNALDAVTHHIYNLGPGVDEHLIEKILDPNYLDGEANTFRNLQNILTSSKTPVTAWVGEAGGAYNSGRNHVTNAFVFSFWYLDQMGMSATYDTKTYCRQSLIGGNYGLLNTSTFVPNPDYYSALLWHRLMGRKVLSAKFSGTNKTRAYAHCAKVSDGITLLLINLDGKKTIHVDDVATHSAFNLRVKHHRHMHSRKKHFKVGGHIQKSSGSGIREEYHLEAQDGNIQSQTMLLNGNILAPTPDGEMPPLVPIKVNSSEAIVVAPFSIVFAHIPDINLPACRS